MDNTAFNKELIRRYRDNTASAEELEVFFQLMQEGKLEEELEMLMKEEVLEETPVKKMPLYRKNWFRLSAAASVIFLLGLTAYFISENKYNPANKVAVNTMLVNDVAAPGKSKASITLANGQTVLLDSLHNGVLATQGNVAITKTTDGQIIYEGNGTETAYNTLSNPRGSTVINLTLSDGTKVWLNSESSLKYPVAFSGAERKVSVSGEAYFEVAPSISPAGGGKRRFIVDVAGKGEVEVLGTHFNINAYADEPTINTTLLEGSVQFSTAISGNNQVVRLTSGQQAQLNEEGKIAVNNSADIDEVMAWKNGEFQFKNADLKAIMRQVMRWYDVEVIYSEGVPERFFTADISRDKSLMGMLKILELSKIHFKLDGNKLIVMP